MKKLLLLLSFFTILYVCLIFPFASYMKNKPFVEKIGYVPNPEVMVLTSIDQKQFLAESLILRVLMYYGGLVNKIMNRIYVAPDFPGMTNTIKAAVRLDPYNTDCYYFAQAVMVWDMNQVRAANELLEIGMRYRDWDWYLPFFAGFNYAYILKDYATAAKYYKRVGELTGNELSINLAGRYLYESGQTDIAIAYLSAMIKSATNNAIRKSLQTRLDAFRGVKLIEQASHDYHLRFKKTPASVELLVKSGHLKERPIDPYGGTFFLDDKGHVRTTSKFAFPVKK